MAVKRNLSGTMVGVREGMGWGTEGRVLISPPTLGPHKPAPCSLTFPSPHAHKQQKAQELEHIKKGKG